MAKERNLNVSDLERLILEKLIAKYEKSSHYLTPGVSARRVLLRLGPGSKDFRLYNIEDAEQKQAVHQAVLRLSDLKLTDYEWERFNTGNVMKNVWLRLDQIEQAYEYIGKIPKQATVQQLSAELKSLLDEASNQDFSDLEANWSSSSASASDLRDGREASSEGVSDSQENRDISTAVPDASGDSNKPKIAEETLTIRSWLVPALDDLRNGMEKKGQIPAVLGGDQKTARDLFIVFKALLDRDFKPIQLRVFSLRCFQDSKYFEQRLKSKLISLMRRCHPVLLEQDTEELMILSDDEILALAGLQRNPEIIEFTGPVKLIMQKRVVDCGPLAAGACLKTDNLDLAAKIEIGRIKRVLLIENRTSYEMAVNGHRLVNYRAKQPEATEEKKQDDLSDKDYGSERPADELVIYHGGFHSQNKQRFFHQLIEAVPSDVPVFHWGDIDLGGFRIFLQIKNNISDRVCPWLMDRETLLAYKHTSRGFDSVYRKNLETALTDPRYHLFRDVIETMLEKGIRLEQEAIALDRSADV